MTSDVDGPRAVPGFVFALWHSYSATVNGYEEVEFPRLVGVYSTQERAEMAAARASALPGFSGDMLAVDSVDGLVIDRVEVGEVAWRGGFFSYDAEGREE
jgi:hypothetical protein